ncbi:DUF4359 domain-containing protein [Dysgonomonas sp. 521]|uniref:DUF4359 domain-containing protein n=1 Tax=Dysgonomonas sp. 521 TaxID=2302932 RepID=UPI0013D375D5|nr:DUF4359 domain-containing protein [Dysgonomonas sp. 521]NDV96295.1 DUF4359 domain-containing protein [Dysgonomonas sp. 521]
MKKLRMFIVLVVIIAVAGVFTNPGEEKHKEALKAKLQSHIEELTAKESLVKRSVGMLVGGAAIDQLVDKVVSVENYYVFSTTNVTLNRKKQMIGIGAFGNIFYTKKMDEVIDEELSQIRF